MKEIHKNWTEYAQIFNPDVIVYEISHFKGYEWKSYPKIGQVYETIIESRLIAYDTALDREVYSENQPVYNMDTFLEKYKGNSGKYSEFNNNLKNIA